MNDISQAKSYYTMRGKKFHQNNSRMQCYDMKEEKKKARSLMLLTSIGLGI